MGKTIAYTLLAIALLTTSGCVPAIPREVLSSVDRSITFGMLIREPAAYKGKTVMVGGTIVKSTNEGSGYTRLEVMQLPLDGDGTPMRGDRSGGRFMVLCKGYLETRIFGPGRLVTVVGAVDGSKKGTVGSMAYEFPVIDSTYLKLWPVPARPMPVYSIGIGFDEGPFPPWGYYPYPYGPFWY
ncbi:MAG: Slp family lipoprotein [Deltaproteobacteria bacterium]|nr:Slp family lipoprotein [Deltaproteobacteria bacterium]